MTRVNATYQFSSASAKREATAAVEAALDGHHEKRIRHEINLLRIHMVTPRSAEAFDRAQRTIAELRANLLEAT